VKKLVIALIALMALFVFISAYSSASTGAGSSVESAALGSVEIE
jgi:hypothetical protein